MGIRARLLRFQPAGVSWAFVHLLDEVRIHYWHRRAVRRARRLGAGTGLKLHLGCGSNRKPGWINIDLFSPEADLRLDLREPFPFGDNSVSAVYSEHFFEHVAYPDHAMHVLRESHRALVPEGLFSVGVPDAVKDITTYLHGDEEYAREVWERWHPKWCNTPMHHLNYHFHQEGDHKYSYDFETLAQVLTEAGFVAIQRRPWNPDLDLESRKGATIYVDARKPGPGA